MLTYQMKLEQHHRKRVLENKLKNVAFNLILDVRAQKQKPKLGEIIKMVREKHSHKNLTLEEIR